MKTSIKFSAFIALSAMIMTQFSCSDETLQIPDNSDPVVVVNSDQEEANVIEEILDEVIIDLEQYDFLKSAETCPAVTIERPDTAKYPKVITKDFGDSCVNDYGVVKSGKIIITIYGPWLEKGSKRIVTFEDYTHRGIAISGKKEIICRGTDENGFFVHAIKGTISLEKPDGLKVERELHKRRLLISGVEDKEAPKEWLVEGYVNVSRSDGVSFEMRIAEPLYRIQGCRWYQSGLKVLSFSSVSENEVDTGQKVFIDYSYAEGDNACDSYVLRWIENEEPEVVNLRDR